MNANQRGKQYVDPQVQGALWKRMVAHWLVFVGVTALLAVGLEWMSDPFRTFPQLAHDIWWNYSPVMLAVLFLIPVFIYDAIRMSHRFAGPVYRLRQVIRSLADGNQPDKVELRDDDFWKEMASDLNRVIDKVRQHPSADDDTYAPVHEPLATTST